MTYRATIVVGLGYGDEGKGTMVDYLCRQVESPTVVRFNGGGQAAHNVVLPDGTHHCFSLFGSGTLAGARTHLSRFVLVNPLAMANEAIAIRKKTGIDPTAITTIDPRCPVVTPWHVEANRWRERKRFEKHGSCGVGIGEVMMDVEKANHISMGELADGDYYWQLKRLQERKFKEFPEMEKHCPSIEEVMDAYDCIIPRLIQKMSYEILGGNLVFEGAQGVLIDEKYGHAPYHTWSNCTFDNAVQVLREIYWSGDVERVGVLRSFATRHGPGPFPTECKELEWAVEDDHNKYNEWQGNFRVGRFDFAAVKYAIESCRGIDSLAVTHLDKMSCRQIFALTVPLRYGSFGPTWKQKKEIS
jgi:adenylosuccinate synthase